MVAMTGCGALLVELQRVGAGQPGQVAGRLDGHALQAEAEPEHRDAVLAGVPGSADLALDAAHAEPAGDDDAVDAGQRRRRAGRGLAVVAGHPAQLHPGPVGEAGRPDRLADRQVRVGQVDVLADDRHRRPCASGGAPAPAGRPSCSSRRRGRRARAGVPRRRRAPRGAAPWGCRRCSARPGRRSPPRGRRRSRATSLCLSFVRDLPVGAADERVGLDADVAQLRHRVLGRLGLQLTRRAPGTAPATRAGRSSCPGRARGGPGGSPPGTAATRCRRRCRRPR